MVEIYIDGSNSKSDGSGDGGYGCVLISKVKKARKEISGYLESPCTNNRAEISALLFALIELKFPSKLKIYSDSMLLIKYFYHIEDQRWYRKNKELRILADEIDILLKQHNYEMIHVKGHSGNCWNEKTHELANLGRKSKKTESNYYQ